MEYVRIKRIIRILGYFIEIIIHGGIEKIIISHVSVCFIAGDDYYSYRLRFHTIDNKNLKNRSVLGFLYSFFNRGLYRFIITRVSGPSAILMKSCDLIGLKP